MFPCIATQGHLQGKLQQCSFGPEHPSPVRLRITRAVLIIPVIVALAPSSVIDPPLLENSTLQICLSTAAQRAMRTRSCNIINTCPQGRQIGPHQNSCAFCSAHSWMNISFCSEVELESLLLHLSPFGCSCPMSVVWFCWYSCSWAAGWKRSSNQPCSVVKPVIFIPNQLLVQPNS